MSVDAVSAVGRLEAAIRSQGITVSGEGSLSERLAACAAAVGGLGVTVAPNVAAITEAVAGLGIDPRDARFDSPAEAEARRQRVEQEQAAAAAATEAAQAAQAEAAAQAELEAKVAAEQAAKEQRLQLLELQARQWFDAAATKAAEAEIIRGRADAMAAELAELEAQS
jgi:hypothetical protein